MPDLRPHITINLDKHDRIIRIRIDGAACVSVFSAARNRWKQFHCPEPGEYHEATGDNMAEAMQDRIEASDPP